MWLTDSLTQRVKREHIEHNDIFSKPFILYDQLEGYASTDPFTVEAK